MSTHTYNLPAYTVKHELIGHPGSNEDNEKETRNFKPRVPKIFKQPSRLIAKKQSSRSFSTVAYYDFTDFITIVGDTIIVFSPRTAPTPSARPVIKITGDANLRPGDGSVASIQPTSIIRNGKTADPLLDAVNSRKQSESSVLTPSTIEEPEELSSSKSPGKNNIFSGSTLLLLLPETESLKPIGLLKIVDSTTSLDGTITYYKNLIYGTYVCTNYAQMIHPSSNAYFFPDKATITYDTTVKPEEETEEPLTAMGIDTTTTTTTLPTKDKTLSSENNELTTPLEETTEDSSTLTITHTNQTKRDFPNDIVNDPQGRSVTGGSAKNNIDNDGKKLEFATRLLPSNAYKTFTYFITFFIPDETNKDLTTTSVQSREVNSSKVSYLTESILLSATNDVSSMYTASTTMPSVDTTFISVSTTTTLSTPSEASPKAEDEDSTTKPEEIELIFKTLYTTYLTTSFQERTSSVSSREVLENNVITQTIRRDGIFGDVAGLFNDITITSTKIQDTVQSSTILVPEEDSVTYEASTTLEDSTTEAGLTTLQDLEDYKSTIENSFNKFSILELSPTPSVVTDLLKFEAKNYFTSYTYFTNMFVDDETKKETRNEVFSNIITEKIEPTIVVSLPQVQPHNRNFIANQ
ncbi:probable serine/threonine-protein kinase nek3 [Microplitis demolitor]|uniref:probable serine/threonine-protein kinase nek3 n=1 Tax=Microplitis demolitor TaxID=69319 RepID=UPI00235B666A|nr:probable serine/threonine-protein kinase nek3 [Microplitis demolitor]